MNTHTAAELTALREDIAARKQILVPIVRDQHGQTIDGFARESIAADLGIKNIPVQIMSVSGPDERRHLGLLLNACRRQLTTTQRRELIVDELTRNPAIGSRKLARLVGCSPQTVCDIRKRLGVHSGQEQEEDEKKTNIIAVTAQQVAMAEKAFGMSDDLPKCAMTAKQAGKQARTRRIARLREQAIPPAASKLGIHCCDFRSLPVKDGSAGLVIADPPYDEPSLPLYGELAAWGAKKLAKDGFLVAYTSVTYLDRVLALMGESLTYCWTIALIHGGAGSKSWNRNAMNDWKALLIFSRGVTLFPRKVVGVIKGNGEEKDLFKWQQGTAEVEYLIRTLSAAGSLIVSPFLGSGTDALATRAVGGRRFVGCDLDAGMVNTTLERLRDGRGESKPTTQWP